MNSLVPPPRDNLALSQARAYDDVTHKNPKGTYGTQDKLYDDHEAYVNSLVPPLRNAATDNLALSQ